MYALLALSCKTKWRKGLKICHLNDLWPSSPQDNDSLASLTSGLEEGLVVSVEDVAESGMDGPEPDDQ